MTKVEMLARIQELELEREELREFCDWFILYFGEPTETYFIKQKEKLLP